MAWGDAGIGQGLYSACVQNGWGTTHETIDLSNDAVDLRELAKLKNEPATWGGHFRVIWQAITGILPVIQRIKRSLESLDGVALS